MKIKTLIKSYEEVLKLKRPVHKRPSRPSRLGQCLIRLASIPELYKTHFSYKKINMERAGRGPWLILMNHCGFIDFKIMTGVLWPKPFNIVTTSEGFIGKERLLRWLGCFPTHKFTTDPNLIRDIKYILQHYHNSVLMYPEAGYSLNGTPTMIHPNFSRLLKILGVPVVMITTSGAFSRNPLYNNLQDRKVKVSAKMECLLSEEDVKSMDIEEMNRIIRDAFDLDYFRWQIENKIPIREPFRADGLNRVLFKCSECGAEGKMEGSGVSITCKACGRTFPMDEYGRLSGTRFPHIPDWYKWEREEIRKEILAGTYSTDTKVRVGMMVNSKALYFVGDGTLHHDINGFVLDACNGALHFSQNPRFNYSINSDFFWYEIGDVICIPKDDILYYCFTEMKDIVAKVKMAVEEIYSVLAGTHSE